ncbi:MAG TPA: lactate dehydrogenase [Desulfobacteraceae bacterium]|nr:MAG: lactate dehydrogenase [Deltaproteobacteria bacterium]HDL07961.1 lactate dehydrogenase [Desulfobacteraceae bacterium]
MKILFAAPENAWGGFLGRIRSELPQHHFEASGRFEVDSLKGFDVLIPTMCSVTRKLIEKADQLKLIQQCGAGIESIDLNAAWEKNIWVANVPTDISGNADSVAELGIYLMIGLSRDVRGMALSLANRKMGEPPGRSLNKKTVGIVGLGGIGKALIKRLKPFGVNLIGIKRDNPEKAMKLLGLDWVGGTEDLTELLEKSDFVVLCLPSSPETKHLIDRNAFYSMKQNAFLINLSRGGLIDRDAMLEALKSKRIAGVGLDVFWEEPPNPDDPVFKYNVMATPHIAGSTDISMDGIVKVVKENICKVEKNQRPFYCFIYTDSFNSRL